MCVAGGIDELWPNCKNGSRLNMLRYGENVATYSRGDRIDLNRISAYDARTDGRNIQPMCMEFDGAIGHCRLLSDSRTLTSSGSPLHRSLEASCRFSP